MNLYCSDFFIHFFLHTPKRILRPRVAKKNIYTLLTALRRMVEEIRLIHSIILKLRINGTDYSFNFIFISYISKTH